MCRCVEDWGLRCHPTRWKFSASRSLALSHHLLTTSITFLCADHPAVGIEPLSCDHTPRGVLHMQYASVPTTWEGNRLATQCTTGAPERIYLWGPQDP
ncbi:hypothetical protein BU26DRAFT_265701 [Trematosphaeria pertusa]|uniref:Uncharacterized protein n=1 Tax=Trematosphaeria pertusa TaxID=390896 RepID=A0A6A6IJK0_9PLEO|nr:uncharacterized protein BU26DRAFT_265701 [Trematosphaeria pertusa]KAF2250556.1 hypothetical protein BU26DRAFT_265701 [Trematosphaeria pertusa]